MSDARDAVATMGSVLPDDVGGRDAVHVAVIAATAGEQLFAGQDVGLTSGLVAGHVKEPIGIVDPFLKRDVQAGQRFWLFLYPRSITSLRHEWTHPKIPDGLGRVGAPALVDKATAEQWLRNFVENSGGPGYHELMAKIEDFARFGSDIDAECLHFSGTDASGSIPDEMWDHAEAVLGKKIDGPRPKFFSCSC